MGSGGRERREGVEGRGGSGTEWLLLVLCKE